MASYSDLATLRDSAPFRARVEIAIAKYAGYILDENPATANHGPRYRWAQNAIVNPRSVAEGLVNAIVLDGTVMVQLDAATDAELQSAVEAVINRVLNS